jgi:hypothetical protein
VALAEVFTKLFEHTSGEKTLSHKDSESAIRSLFDEVLPTYDRERFHLSDMRKVCQWFNILVGAGMTDFSIEEPEAEAEAEAE